MQTFDRLFLRANRLALIVLLAAMAMMVFANVALRYRPTTRSCGSRRRRATR